MENKTDIRNQQTVIEAAIIAGDGEVLSEWTGWTTSSYLTIRYLRVILEIRLSDHGVGFRRGMDSHTIFVWDTNSNEELVDTIQAKFDAIDRQLLPEINAKAEFQTKGLSIKTNKYGYPLHYGRIIKWQKALRLAS